MQSDLLLCAIERKKEREALTILRLKYLHTSRPNPLGQTLLHAACQHGLELGVEELLANHINALEAQGIDTRDKNAIQYASRGRHLGIVRRLLDYGIRAVPLGIYLYESCQPELKITSSIATEGTKRDSATPIIH